MDKLCASVVVLDEINLTLRLFIEVINTPVVTAHSPPHSMSHESEVWELTFIGGFLCIIFTYS